MVTVGFKIEMRGYYMNSYSTAIYSLIAVAASIAAGFMSAFALEYILLVAAVVMVIVLVYRKGWKWTLGVGGIIFLSTGFLINFVDGLIIAIGVLLPGMGIGLSLRAETGMKEVVSTGGSGFLVAALINYLKVKQLSDENLFQSLLYRMCNDLFFYRNSIISGLENGGVAAQNLEERIEEIRLTTQILTSILPAMLLIGCAVTAYLALHSAIGLMRRNNVVVYGILPFSKFRASGVVSIAFAVCILLSFNFMGTRLAGVWGNAAVILAFYIAICGLSTIDFYLKRKFRKLWQRLMLYIPIIGMLSASGGPMMLLNPMMFLLIVGIADSVFDIRDIKKKRGDSSGS